MNPATPDGVTRTVYALKVKTTMLARAHRFVPEDVRALSVGAVASAIELAKSIVAQVLRI